MNTSITYFLENKLGGVFSLNENLIRNKSGHDFTQSVIYLDCKESNYAKRYELIGTDKENYFRYSNLENSFFVLKRLYKLISNQQGAFVTNDGLEMAMLSLFPTTQTVFQLVHDQYNLNLAKKFHTVVDVFIAHSSFFADKLREELPFRKEDVYYLPHGIPFYDDIQRKKSDRKLKLIFIGRITESKGVFLLPEIDKGLRDRNILVEWTIVGEGPQKEELKNVWHYKEHVNFISPRTTREVLEVAGQHDVFVLPTFFEGSPVSLLEAMSVGLVPVISDLPGGIREIVTPEIGFRPTPGNVEEFVKYILLLYNDPSLIVKLGNASENLIRSKYDVRITAKAYHNLFSNYYNLKRKNIERENIRTGFKLDSRFIPNALVYAIRKFRKSISKN